MIVALVIALLITLAAAGAVALGAARWQRQTEDVRAKLWAARGSITPPTYNARELESLPAPVQRYFRAVLKDGQPIISGVRIMQEGELRQGEGDAWRPFEATQWITARPRGFDWDARMKIAPAISVHVRDAYMGGAGVLHAAVLGLVTVADMHGTPEMAEGELLRYLAEAPWYPTALLPSQGVRWEPIDDARARATLVDGSTRVSLEFRFGQHDFVASVWHPARPRLVDGAVQCAPWQGLHAGYRECAGMLVPLQGEVQWHLPETVPVWRGHITRIEYEHAR